MKTVPERKHVANVFIVCCFINSAQNLYSNIDSSLNKLRLCSSSSYPTTFLSPPDLGELHNETMLNCIIWMGQLLTTAIKASAFIIAKPLSELVTESFEFGSFPQNLKYSQMKLIVFKVYKVELSNYRPI